METVAHRNIYKIFKEKLKNDWKLTPTCDVHKPNACSCRNPLYRTTSIRRWMTQRKENEEKTYGEYLLERANLKENLNSNTNFYDPSSIFKGDKKCIIVFTILLSQKLGHLVYHFQKANIVDNRLEMNLEKTDTRYKRLMEGLRGRKDVDDNNSENIIQAFERERWNFPPSLSFKMEEEFVDSVRLPFHERKEGKAGGQGSILRVLVHEDFASANLKEQLEESALKIDNAGKCYRLAVKVYQKNQEELYQQEIDAYKGLTNVPGMVKYLGCYVHHDGQGERTFNILLEMGNMDLWDCFSNEYPPVLLSDIAKFWQAILKIATVIQSIHELDHRGDHYFGWHGDVKPNNILLVGPDLKLVDFGFTKFKKDKGEAEISQYLNGGNNTYSAPELARPKFVTRNVRLAQFIDIWSFGCVMSVAATWIVLGGQGVKQYTMLRSSARKRLIPAQGNNAFHNGIHILPEIKDWHSFLNSHKRLTDPFTPEILNLIENRLLRGSPEERLNSKELCTELGSIIQQDIDIQQPALSVLDALVAKPSATAARDKSNESNSQARTSSETKRSSVDSKTQSQPASTSYRKDTVDWSLTREGSIQPIAVDEHFKRKPLPTRPQRSEDAVPKDSSFQSGPKTTTETESPYTSMSHHPPSHRELARSFNQSMEEPSQTPPQPRHHPEKIWEVVKHKKDPGSVYHDVCYQILTNYPEVRESINEDGLTPIMEAAKEDNTRIVRLLLNMSPLTKRDAEGKTVLHYAVLKTKHETSDFLELIRDMVKIARSKHPDSEFIDALDSNYGSPLYYCVDIGKLKTATILLELRAKINPFEGSQRNENDVFVHAAQLENKDMLGVLMKNGATYDLNALRKSHRVSKGIISYIRSEQKKY